MTTGQNTHTHTHIHTRTNYNTHHHINNNTILILALTYSLALTLPRHPLNLLPLTPLLQQYKCILEIYYCKYILLTYN